MGFFGRRKQNAPAAGATELPNDRPRAANPPRRHYEELGTIDYVNLTSDGKHGRHGPAVEAAAEAGRPIFANFVEWSGWRGCKDAGRIFADPVVRRAAEELFVPAAFNTWDRGDSGRGEPFRRWGAGLADSWWGYLRIVDPGGERVVAGTRQITSYANLEEVKQVMREGLEGLGMDVPGYLK